MIKECLTYYEDGSIGGIYYDCIDIDFIPEYNIFNSYTNTTTVNFITTDYEEAIKKRDTLIKENVFNGINLLLPLEPLETYNDRCVEYMKKIDKYQQRLNETESKEQIKKK